ncbi:MAG: sialidase family protein [Gemmatimonadales bacterium]
MKTISLLATGLAILASPGRVATPPPEWTGPVGSSKPSLVATRNGELLVTWLEPAATGYTLRLAATEKGVWGAPVTVTQSGRLFVNWADFPSVTETSTGTIVVHWLEKTEAKPYAYHVRLSTSADRGRTWSAPVTAHQDLSPTEHGFVSLVPNRDGSVSVGWLDGGAMTDHNGSMSARMAVLQPDGTMTGETVLDARTCECCQLSMAMARSGLVVAYRDRSEEEVRDIAVVRQVNGKWTDPQPVHRDNWVWKACPVNGPSIAAAGDQVAVTWYTAAGGRPTVKAAFSANGGASFGTPVVIDQGSPLGRQQLQLLDAGRAAVVWLELAGDEAEWKVRTVDTRGTAGSPRTIGNTSRARDSGFPRTALLGTDLFVAWAEPGPTPRESRVRVSRLPMR